jgi:hypothetical protein
VPGLIAAVFVWEKHLGLHDFVDSILAHVNSVCVSSEVRLNFSKVSFLSVFGLRVYFVGAFEGEGLFFGGEDQSPILKLDLVLWPYHVETCPASGDHGPQSLVGSDFVEDLKLWIFVENEILEDMFLLCFTLWLILRFLLFFKLLIQLGFSLGVRLFLFLFLMLL